MREVRHLYVSVDGVDMFYREAGPPEKPTLLLLHGFPSSSIQFRHLLTGVADRWHLVAPDLPGFGFTKLNNSHYSFTFDGLASTIRAFIRNLNLNVSAVYLHDYGGHAGFRLLTDATVHPRALIIQNTEAYHGVGWHDMMWSIDKRLSDPPDEARARLLKDLLNKEGIRKEFLEALPSTIAEQIDPAIVELGWIRMQEPGTIDAMLDLHMDYGSNIQQYSIIQAHFRSAATPVLLLWGTRDQYLSTDAADAYKHDLKNWEMRLTDGGHWVLESHAREVNEAVWDFLSRHLS
jgi:pimeloyl-ACP methyl ester carboxylesterase